MDRPGKGTPVSLVVAFCVASCMVLRSTQSPWLSEWVIGYFLTLQHWELYEGEVMILREWGKNGHGCFVLLYHSCLTCVSSYAMGALLITVLVPMCIGPLEWMDKRVLHHFCLGWPNRQAGPTVMRWMVPVAKMKLLSNIAALEIELGSRG